MPNYCILSAQHDFRSARRASVHFIASELARRGSVRFFSCRFSGLSRFRPGDPRTPLAARANIPETHDGVACFLWRPTVHPIALPHALERLEAWTFRRYVEAAPAILREWIAESDVIIIESGISLIFYDLIRALNPRARVAYTMSDDLETIGAARAVRTKLKEVYRGFDLIRVPSRSAMADFPGGRVAFIPHGMDVSSADRPTTSPYEPGTLNGISVGSMLFDSRFFAIAAAAMPDVRFHVIGSGLVNRRLSVGNVEYYPEMAYEDTIPFVKHASFGIAPYRPERATPALSDTSLKLTQFAYFGLPAVCPRIVADQPLRFGYELTADSIRTAIREALASPRIPRRAWTWTEAVDAMLERLAPDGAA